MNSFTNSVDIGLNQVRIIVQGMLRVAHSDGLHERELVLIRQFYEGCREEAKGLADFADLRDVPFDAELARELLTSDEQKLAFLTSCYLVAYADGELSDAEKQCLAELVTAIDAAKLATEAQDRVRDQLLMQLARSDNVEALQQIAKDL